MSIIELNLNRMKGSFNVIDMIQKVKTTRIKNENV